MYPDRAIEISSSSRESSRSAASGGFYTVEYQSGAHRGTVLAKRSGRLSVHHIRITEGDRVRVEISPYDTARGRITRRL